MTEKEIDKAIAESRANFAFEGMYLTEEDERDARSILRGEITADEAIARIIKEIPGKKFSPPNPKAVKVVEEILGEVLPSLYSLPETPETETLIKRMIDDKNVLLRPDCATDDLERIRQEVHEATQFIEEYRK